MTRAALLTVVLAALLSAPMTAHAQRLRAPNTEETEPAPRAPPPAVRAPPEARGGGGAAAPAKRVPLATVISLINRRTPGKQLDAGEENGARPVYWVRWQAEDGRRIDYRVDAQTGAILSEKGG